MLEEKASKNQRVSFRNNLSAWAAVSVSAVLLAVFLLKGTAMSENPFPHRVKIGPFPEGLEWINTKRELQLDKLRGKFVLLDFWTYCCINCMHVLPELKKLERAYPNNLVVIGVHSAKFTAEKDSENIREAVLRYKIEHPVVNDAKMILWQRIGVRAWPTLLLIDPQGYAVWLKSGESTFEELDAVLKKAIPYYRGKKLLDEKPVRFDLEASRAKKTPLRFPGKVLADESGNRLFIADSNHNRIVVTRLDGTLLETIGAGTIGRSDGDYATAQFNSPQGMALDDETLYVADTENHLIRKVDLKNHRVTTIAGTGKQRRGLLQLEPEGQPLKTALSNPWALCVHDGYLYVAMAGTHQIWRMSLSEPEIGPYAGNGREDIVDGPLLPEEPYKLGFASFAQPSGLASDGKWLYVADSEGSSIRAVPFNPAGKVKTVVGTAGLPGARLFTFGDVDGQRRRVRLQHALGVVYYEGRVYVADTYNNKIKVIDPASGSTQTLAGTGKPGAADAPATFDEPAGITAAGGKLFLADTNNHLIRVVNLRESNQVSTLSIPKLKPPETPSASAKPNTADVPDRGN